MKSVCSLCFSHSISPSFSLLLSGSVGLTFPAINIHPLLLLLLLSLTLCSIFPFLSSISIPPLTLSFSTLPLPSFHSSNPSSLPVSLPPSLPTHFLLSCFLFHLSILS